MRRHQHTRSWNEDRSSIRNEVEMAEAATMIRALGARAVLVKGGHLVVQGSRQTAGGSRGSG